MARYTFYTQIKSYFKYSQAFMNCLIVLVFLLSCYAVIFLHKTSLAFIPFALILAYNIFLYRPTIKYWDMGGFKKMTIDTDAKVIIFDGRVRLNFRDIERVRLDLDERPTMIWLLGLGMQYSELINGELVFKRTSSDSDTTVINFQMRKDVEKVSSLIRKSGKPFRIRHEELLDEGVPSYMWFLLSAIVIVVLGGYMLKEFFVKVFTQTGM